MPGAAPEAEPGAVPGIPGRRRAAGGHAREPSHPQDHPQSRKAHESRSRQEKVNADRTVRHHRAGRLVLR